MVRGRHLNQEEAGSQGSEEGVQRVHDPTVMHGHNRTGFSCTKNLPGNPPVLASLRGVGGGLGLLARQG